MKKDNQTQQDNTGGIPHSPEFWVIKKADPVPQENTKHSLTITPP